MVARRAWVLAAHERPGVAVTTNLRLLRPGIVAGVGLVLSDFLAFEDW